MLENLKQNKTFYISILLFLIITIPNMLMHIPHCDEAQNFMAAYFINFSNWTQITSFHGHPLIWYIILLPFSKTGFLYPYPMLILNYLFLIISLIIMWKKAPFDDVFKIIITFSFMMVSYFAIIGRCYTIGILGLFILAALYPQKHERPILYSVLLGLTANTSAMAAIPVIALSSIFMFDIYQKKKIVTEQNVVYCFFILLFFAIFFLYPFIITTNIHIDGINTFFNIINKFFIPIKYNYVFLISYFFVFSYLLFVPKDIKSKTFLLSSTLILWLFFYFVYTGLDYHKFFFFIFIIITMWIQKSFEKCDKNSIIFILAFTIMMMTPYNIEYCHGNKSIYEFGKIIKKDAAKYQNSILSVPDFGMRYELAPFIIFNKNKIDLYGTMDFYNFRMDEAEGKDGIEKIKQFATEQDKPVYILTDREIEDLELYDKYKDLNIYKAN